MGTDNPKLIPDDAVEAAISRVLEAETAARADVVRARSEALVLAEQVREQVRCLGLHTDRRIHRVRAAFVAKVTGEVTALEAAAAALGATLDLSPAEVLRVESAVAALACGMTGGPA